MSNSNNIDNKSNDDGNNSSEMISKGMEKMNCKSLEFFKIQS